MGSISLVMMMDRARRALGTRHVLLVWITMATQRTVTAFGAISLPAVVVRFALRGKKPVKNVKAVRHRSVLTEMFVVPKDDSSSVNLHAGSLLPSRKFDLGRRPAFGNLGFHMFKGSSKLAEITQACRSFDWAYGCLKAQAR